MIHVLFPEEPGRVWALGLWLTGSSWQMPTIHALFKSVNSWSENVIASTLRNQPHEMGLWAVVSSSWHTGPPSPRHHLPLHLSLSSFLPWPWGPDSPEASHHGLWIHITSFHTYMCSAYDILPPSSLAPHFTPTNTTQIPLVQKAFPNCTSLSLTLAFSMLPITMSNVLWIPMIYSAPTAEQKVL